MYALATLFPLDHDLTAQLTHSETTPGIFVL